MPNESITLRELQLVDCKSVALLIERANAQRDDQSLPDHLETESTVDNLKAKIEKTGTWADVACVDGDIGGIILGYPASEATDLPPEYLEATYISLLMVEPDHWGKGIASVLLNEAASRTQKNRNQQLLLLTRKANNLHARSIYEHKGYKQTGHTRRSKYGQQLLYLLDLS